MKKHIRYMCAVVAAILVMLSGVAVIAYSADDSVMEMIEMQPEAESSGSIQEYIDNVLAERAGDGTTEWYVISFARAGELDFTAYNLTIEARITSPNLRATDYERMALAYSICGGNNLDIGEIVDRNWDKLGIMSEIYALILLNSGDYYCNTDEGVILRSILDREKDNGGWTLTGNYADTDVTAITLQALSAYRSIPEVNEAIERGLNTLSSIQRESGGFASYGTENAESCAQVIITLKQLGIDPETDSRFIKNGNDPVSALMSYKCESGGFSHIMGADKNDMATVQAIEAMTAIEQGSLYVLREKHVNIPEKEPAEITTVADDIPNITDIPKETHAAAIIVTTETTADTANIKITDITDAVSEEITQPLENNTAEPIEEVSVEDEIYNEVTAYETQAVSTATHTTTKTTSTHLKTGVTATDRKTNTTATQISKISETSAITEKTDKNAGLGWKFWAFIIIGFVLIFSELYIIFMKQFTWKKGLIIFVICSVLGTGVYFLDIQSAEDFYDRNSEIVDENSLTVTLSIDCNVLSDEISENCGIIPESEFVLQEGDTVFDILERALAENKIPFDYSGKGSTVYIRGINNIYEFEHGEMSGWMYLVNGTSINVGCGSYYPKDGDVIKWEYTRNMGKDIGIEEEYPT